MWRWELGEMGCDGPTTVPQKVNVVSIMIGKYRVDTTINAQHQIQRIHTMVAEPALGDFNYDHESTNQQTFGSIKWPTAWHSHHGWDDNYGFDNVSAGHNGFGGTFARVEPNVCPDAVPVPEAIRRASRASPAPPAVVPVDEARSLAVIETIAQRTPNKPIRYLIGSHPHFDHIGGLRTYLHIGATIVTQRKNINFLNDDVLN